MRTVLCLAAALVATATTTACGSDSDSSSTSTSASTQASTGATENPLVAETAKALDEARKPITEFAPGPTEAPGPIPKAKRLAVVYIISAPFPENVVKSTEAAAAAVGWSVRTFNSQGTPQGIQSAMSSAMGIKPDALVLAAMPAAFMKPQIAKAKATGIPVIALSPGLPEGMTYQEAGLDNEVQYEATRVGKTLGQWVLNKWPDGAEVLALTSPEFADLTLMSELFQKTITDAGDKFSVGQTVASPVGDAGGGQTGVSRLAAPMRSHPKAKAMYINSESWFNTFLQASKVAAQGREVVGLGADGDLSIPLVQKGTPIVMMGSDSTTYGWYGVDSLIRYFNKKEQPDYVVPLRLVDAKNAGSIDTEGIRTEYDNAAEWKKLWGIG